MTKTKKVQKLADLSLLLAVAGAILLYPIGGALLDGMFLFVKALMITGLFLMRFSGSQSTRGFMIWLNGSIWDVLMTVIKWTMTASVSVWQLLLYIGNMAADIGMPVAVYHSAR